MTSLDDVSAEQPLSADQCRSSIISEAQHLSAIGQYDSAAKLYHDYLLANPDDAGMFRRFASLRRLQGKHQWASSLIRRAECLEQHGLATYKGDSKPRLKNSPPESPPFEAVTPAKPENAVLSYQQSVAEDHKSRRVVFDPFLESSDGSSTPAVNEPDGTTASEGATPTTGEVLLGARKGETLHLLTPCEQPHRPISRTGVRIRYKRRQYVLDGEEGSGSREPNGPSRKSNREPAEPTQYRSAPEIGNVPNAIPDTEAPTSPPSQGSPEIELDLYARSAYAAKQCDWLDVLFADEGNESTEDPGLSLEEEDALPDAEQNPTDTELDWLDLAPDDEEDLESSDGHIHAADLNEVDTETYQLSDWDKARLMAHDLALESGDGSTELTRALVRVFFVSPWSATKRAMERSLAQGASAGDLELALEVRRIWAEHPEFALSFPRKFFLGEGWQRREEARCMLGWPLALRVAASWPAFPDPDEIEVFLVDAYEHWRIRDELHRQFPEFRLYLNHRVGGVPGGLQIWPEWTFEAHVNWQDPGLRLDTAGERQLYRDMLTSWGIRSYDTPSAATSTTKLVKRSSGGTTEEDSGADALEESK